jgi:hypothetical protein
MYVTLYSPTGQTLGNYSDGFDAQVGYGGQCNLSPLTKATFKFIDQTTATFINSDPVHPQTFYAFDRNKLIIGLIIEAAAPAPPSADELAVESQKAARQRQVDFETTLQQQRQSEASRHFQSNHFQSNMGTALVVIAIVAVCVIAVRRQH